MFAEMHESGVFARVLRRFSLQHFEKAPCAAP
jgi:hypothetical protein